PFHFERPVRGFGLITSTPYGVSEICGLCIDWLELKVFTNRGRHGLRQRFGNVSPFQLFNLNGGFPLDGFRVRTLAVGVVYSVGRVNCRPRPEQCPTQKVVIASFWVASSVLFEPTHRGNPFMLF